MSAQRFSTSSLIAAAPRIPVLNRAAVKPSLPRSREAAPRRFWETTVKEQAMESYGISYFKQLTTDFLAISNPQPSTVALQLDAVIKKPNAPADWDDVYVLERGVIAVSPDSLLRARLPFLRSEFESAATSDEFQAYLRTGPPDAQNAPIDKVRADALALIDQIQWRSITVPFFEELRTHLMGQIVLMTGAYIVFAIALLVVLGIYNEDSFVIVAILCGILGGAVKGEIIVQQRPSKPITEASVGDFI